MEYTNIFTPILCIGLSILLGLLIGSIATFYITIKENKKLQDELDKFRKLYFHEIDKWKNKYTDNDPCDRFHNNQY